MASIKPFKSIRPSEQMAEVIAALPYDVYNRAEAKEVVAKNPKSFLAIDRAETQFPDDVDTYDERVWRRVLSKGHMSKALIDMEKIENVSPFIDCVFVSGEYEDEDTRTLW